MYSKVEDPSIDSVILVKLTFIQYGFGIRSMRQTIEDVETNMAYRWFLGYGFQCLLLHVRDETNLNPVLSELHFSGSENSVEHE
jgi:transposase